MQLTGSELRALHTRACGALLKTDGTVHPYVFHRIESAADGRVAMLLTKTFEGSRGAHSLRITGMPPDVDFDNNQLNDKRMWEFIRDVLDEIPLVPSPRCVNHGDGRGCK
ncbi:UNVERIFIED_ORG: hypothetical protein ABIC54_006450 [Burkholderia sp. 1263]